MLHCQFKLVILLYTYLGEWEQELFGKSDRLPTHYWRYADDAWGLWEHGLEKLQEFHKLANSLHPQIKAELRFSSQQIKFLDVNIKIKDGFIQTDLISKDTDKHMYLHVASRHPISVKTVIPYGLEIRENEFAPRMRTTVFAGQKLKHIYAKEDIQTTWWKSN